MREALLRIDVESVIVHHVTAASFVTSQLKAARHRMEEVGPDL
jgi:hypothetical protein